MTSKLEERAREFVIGLEDCRIDGCSAIHDVHAINCRFVLEQRALDLLTSVQAEARLDGMITQLKAVAGYLPPSEYGHRLRELERRLAQAAAPATKEE